MTEEELEAMRHRNEQRAAAMAAELRARGLLALDGAPAYRPVLPGARGSLLRVNPNRTATPPRPVWHLPRRAG
jgi:hypothetical protein